MKEAIASLKNSIKQHVVLAADFNRRIRESSGMDRWRARVEKSIHGRYTRHLLLAYAMVRGIPYRALEQTCKEDEDENSRSWMFSSVRLALSEHGVRVAEGDVQAWMDVPVGKEAGRCAA